MPADQVFYEVQRALVEHGCDHIPTLESHATNGNTFLDLARADDLDLMLYSFVHFNSHYYGVLFQRNNLYTSLSKDTALLLIKKRHRLEIDKINKHFNHQ